MSRRLLKSTAIVSAATMLSRVLGLLRDVVFANLFGAKEVMDAFIVAFKIPNFLRRIFAEGAFSQAFVPVLSEYRSKREQLAVRALVASTAGTLAGVLLLLTTAAILGAPVLAAVFAPDYYLHQPEQFALTVDLLRITFSYLFFISLTALAAGVLNTYGRFAVPAITPVWLNICLIGAAFFLTPLFEPNIIGLAWGVFLAGFVQLIFQLPALAREGMLPLPRWGWRDEGVQRIFKLMLPAIFGASVAQINLLLDTVIATFLAAGSVSWLYYSDRLMELPLGVFGIALATVILPSLSKLHVEEDPRAFSATLDWALRMSLLIGLPAATGLLLLAGPLLATLFQYGAFGGEDVRAASLSLMAYAFGLLGFILVKVLVPGFYSRQDTKTPVKIALIALVANMVLNLIIVVPMVMHDVTGPHAGLALATSIAAFINAGILLFTLQRQGVYRAQPGWWGFVARLLLAVVLMGAGLVWAQGPLEDWLNATLWQRVLHLAGLIIGGGVLYFAVLWLIGLSPVKLLGRRP